MALFEYKASGKKGAKSEGTVEASSKIAASQLLNKQGLQIITIREKKDGFDPNNLSFDLIKPKHVKSKDLVVFTRQLATMINAGVPLVRSLSTLQAQTNNPYFKKQLIEVVHTVEAGNTLASALKKYPKTFSSVYVNMVAAGEAGGILDEILQRLAKQQEKEASMKKKVRSASVYPMVLIVITVIAFFGLMLFVIPKIGKILTDLGGEDAKLPIYTTVMLGISDFMVNYWFIIVIAVVGSIVLIRRFIKTTRGRKKWHQLLLKIPVLKIIITKVAVARFARTFASLMSAGVGVLDALNVTGAAIGNVVIEEELQKAAENVKNGHQLSESLSESKVFPPIVAQMLAVGEETGEIDTILIKVADFYEEEVDALIDGLSSIIEPIMIVVMGAMVGLIALSVMGPISSLSNNIN